VKDLVIDIAKALVDIPDEVTVREVEGEQVTVLELRVAPTDLGKVIGRGGRTARALRTVMTALGGRGVIEYFIAPTVLPRCRSELLVESDGLGGHRKKLPVFRRERGRRGRPRWSPRNGWSGGRRWRRRGGSWRLPDDRVLPFLEQRAPKSRAGEDSQNRTAGKR